MKPKKKNIKWLKTSHCLAPCPPHFRPAGLINWTINIPVPQQHSSQFPIVAGQNPVYFLPPVLPVKLWKCQMGSGGQFLHYLNTQNCVSCLQWRGGSGSKTQSDRPRSRHKGRELWAELWWGTVRPCPGSLIHYLFVRLCVYVCDSPFTLANVILFAYVVFIHTPAFWWTFRAACGAGRLPGWGRKSIQELPFRLGGHT